MPGGSRIRHPLPDARWPSAEEAAASLLFSPVQVGPLTLARRTWVPAMVPWRATGDGEVTEALLAWYGRLAEGRPGALVVEATGIRDVPSGPLLRIGDDRFVPGLARLVDVVRARSGGETRLFVQLIDFLAVRRRPEPARYFERFLALRAEHAARLAARLGEPRWLGAAPAELRARLAELGDADLEAVLSPRELEDLRSGHRERVTDMHLPHVRELPAVLPGLFARAAARAEAAGFDGVELHAAHAYTLASFLSRTNDRPDGSGGDLAGRARVPLAVLEATRAAVAPRLAVGIRLLGDEAIEGGSPVEDAAWFAARFAEAGVDFVSVSKGGKFDDARQPRIGAAVYPYTGPSGHECMPTVLSDARGPFGRNLPLARAVRAAVRATGRAVPVVAAGGINTFELAEGALRGGDADVIASARQSLADPDWLEKVRLGRGAEVRRCAMTNYCEGLDQQHREVTCRLWDREPPDDGPASTSRDGKRRLVAPPWRRGAP